jgi:hypothetical protein
MASIKHKFDGGVIAALLAKSTIFNQLPSVAPLPLLPCSSAL